VEKYDVAIIGAGLTGAAAGQLLSQRLPEARILLVEAQPAFEAGSLPTGDVAGIFLTRRLRVWDHLARHELPAHGPRFWFHDDDVLRIQDASELGTWLLPPTPSFLARKDLLSEHVLAQAVRSGCELMRPVHVAGVDLGDYDARLTVEAHDGRSQQIAARWVLDASGRSTVLGRHLGLVQPNREHPIASIVGRWRGDLDLDGPVFAGESDFGRGALVSRRLCANHFQGYGYRVSFDALGNRGDESRELVVSLLFDKRVLDLHRAEDIGDAYTAFLSGLPATRQILQRAELPRQALKVTPHVAYDLDRLAGPGWALLGSASGYVDPCCSPGTDHAARTIEAVVELVTEQLEGRPVADALDRHDRLFRTSWRRTFQARFKDRYLLDGDFDLFWPSFMMDRALYMLSEVAPVAWRTTRYLKRAPLTGPLGWLRAGLMRAYSRRFLTLARRRMWTGHYGRSNHNIRLHYKTDLGWGSLVTLVHGLAGWGLREFEGLGLAVDRLRRRKELLEGADLVTLPEGIDILSDG
jgi:flavin-dependent dehydrogenase